MPAHGSGQYLSLDVAAHGNEPVDVAAVVDPGDVLLDDRAFVEVRCDVVGGSPNDLHAVCVCLGVGPGSLEARQERVVDVDDPALELLAHVGGQDLHVTREHDKIDVFGGDQLEQPLLLVGPGLRRDRQVVKGHAVPADQLLGGTVVGHDTDDLDGQCPGTAT